MKTTIEETYTCVLCGSEETGWGNNPAPLNGGKGRCCTVCNLTKVIPARVRIRTGMELSE